MTLNTFKSCWTTLPSLVVMLSFAFIDGQLLAQTPVISATTLPKLKDTDNDGFLDGPDSWIDYGQAGFWFRTGEDKNGDGKINIAGKDGKLHTEDDESDPNDPNSIPFKDVLLKDVDKDGLHNDLEELWGSDADKMDSDNDGVLDGDEIYIYHTNPQISDSDNDGLPDGFELGLTYSTSGDGKNDYNKEWFDSIDKTLGYRYRSGADSPVSEQFHFVPNANPLYRSDPNCYDSDFDGIDDVDELNQNKDPMRGLVRAIDQNADSDDIAQRKVLPTYKEGFAPVNKNYEIYLNVIMDDNGEIHWESKISVCLGQSIDIPITISSSPSLPVFDGGDGNYVNSIVIDRNGVESKNNKIVEIKIRCPNPEPESLQLTVVRGASDVMHYTVGKSSYYVHSDVYQEYLEQ